MQIEGFEIPHRICKKTGQILVNPNDLTYYEDNWDTYGEPEDDPNYDANYASIEKIGIQTPPKCNKKGELRGGNTRVYIARALGLTEIAIILISEELDPMKEHENVVGDNCGTRKKTYKIVLNEYESLERKFYKLNGGVSPSKDKKDEWIEKLKTGCSLTVSHDSIAKLKLIRERDPQAFSLLDTEKKTLNQVYTSVKTSKPKKPINPNRHDFFKDLRDDPRIALYGVYNGIKAVKSYVEEKMLSMNGELVNVVFDDEIGEERHLFSGVVSNKFMTSFAKAFKDSGLVGAVQTPIKRMGDPDIQFPDLSDPKFEKEVIEQKASEDRQGSGIRIYGGERATTINPHEYIFVFWADNFKQLAIVMCTMTGDDWNKSDDSKSKDCYTTIDKIFKNHTKDVDLVCLAGDVFLSNGKAHINYENVDDLFNKLEKKIKFS